MIFFDLVKYADTVFRNLEPLNMHVIACKKFFLAQLGTQKLLAFD
jgi:hypothetical protein